MHYGCLWRNMWKFEKLRIVSLWHAVKSTKREKINGRNRMKKKKKKKNKCLSFKVICYFMLLIDYWSCWSFWEGVLLRSYMCWSCWWMLRRSDVEVGSSPIFPGFLAPHGHNFPTYIPCPCPIQVWSPLGYYCLYWICLERFSTLW